MDHRDVTNRDLLIGLLALQNGLVEQDVLILAFRAWTRDKSRPIAEILAAQGAIDADERALLEGLAVKHLGRHGDDPERSLAALSPGSSIRASLAKIGDPDIEATLGHVGSGSGPTENADAERTGSYAAGTAAGDGLRFRVLRPHARGGLGAVFVALDAELNREVALKQILDHHADDPNSRMRFVLEAEITGGLEHPGIVPVYGLGNYGDGRPYYAMRFVRGDSLKETIATFHADETLKHDPGRRSLELRKLLRRFGDVCNAIGYAHTRGVVHRDIKPANVIVGKHGETLVVDWGLAKALGKSEPGSPTGERTLMPSSASGSAETLPGSAMGTPAYMSPEQAAGDLDRLGPRSDVYSLGATFYCLLTGKPPFEQDDIGAVLRAVDKGDFPPPRRLDPSIDRALEAVCLKAMALKPEDRYATARALADDVERWAADEPVNAWREPWPRTLVRWLTRHRVGVTAAGAAVLVALAGTGAVLAVQTRANAELKAANTDLGVANTKVTRANAELASSNQRERARFELAQEAIQTFHTGVSEDLLLKQKEFRELRIKLLRGAQQFYQKLEGLLGGHADRESRRALGRAYLEVGKLTGQLDSMQDSLAMNQRALALFEELASEAPDDAELRREIVRSSVAVATRLSSVGQKAEARAAVGRALTLAQALAAADPADLGRRGELARVEHLHGEFLVDNSRVREGMEAMQRARAIQEDLVRASPALEDLRFELAETCDSLAVHLNDAGLREQALAVYRQARDLGEGLWRANPTDARIAHELVRTLGNMAIPLDDAGRSNEALAAYGRAREVLEAMGNAYPNLLFVTRDRAWIDMATALMLIDAEREAEALAALEGARKARETLVKADPSVIRDQTQHITIYRRIAEIQTQAGRVSEARATCQSALANASRLADTHPGNVALQSQLAEVYNDVADFHAATGEPAEALSFLAKSEAIRRKVAGAIPSRQKYRTILSDGLRRRGITLKKCGRPAAAVAAFREAITVLEGLASPMPTEIYDLACNQALLSAIVPETGPGLRTADGPAEADKAMASLRRAVADGWGQAAHMRIDSDLASIRARPDFQMLLINMGFPADPFAPGD